MALVDGWVAIVVGLGGMLGWLSVMMWDTPGEGPVRPCSGRRGCCMGWTSSGGDMWAELEWAMADRLADCWGC